MFIIFSSVIDSNDSLQPFTFKRFIATVKKIGQPGHPLPPLDAVDFHGCLSPVVPGYEMPHVEEFGMTEEEFAEGLHIWKGGEIEALKRFDALVKQVYLKQVMLHSLVLFSYHW